MQDEVKRYEWEAGDVIYITPNIVHQHFNADPDRSVRLTSAINRIDQKFGLNDIEQREDALAYKPGITLTPEMTADYLKPKVKASLD